MMKYDARYEEFVNKRYKEPEDGNFVDGNFADATREILEAVPSDSNIGDEVENNFSGKSLKYRHFKTGSCPKFSSTHQ